MNNPEMLPELFRGQQGHTYLPYNLENNAVTPRYTRFCKIKNHIVHEVKGLVMQLFSNFLVSRLKKNLQGLLFKNYENIPNYF